MATKLEKKPTLFQAAQNAIARKPAWKHSFQYNKEMNAKYAEKLDKAADTLIELINIGESFITFNILNFFRNFICERMGTSPRG
jgi:hypothetical protein